MILIQGKKYKFLPEFKAVEKLPLGTYLVRVDVVTEKLYLEKTDDLTLPSKLYHQQNFDRVPYFLERFDAEKNNKAVMLTGIKGTGKTVLAKKLCIESKKPVLILAEDYDDDRLIELLTKPELQDSIVFCDEFEKIYRGYGRDNPGLLSLMSNQYPTHLFFVLTSNDQIRGYMRDRPGRIRWILEYDYLTFEQKEEIIKDMIPSAEMQIQVSERMESYPSTYDTMISVCDEIQHGLSLENALEILNVFEQKSVTFRFSDTRISAKEEFTVVPIHGTKLDFSRIGYGTSKLMDFTKSEISFKDEKNLYHTIRIEVIN